MPHYPPEAGVPATGSPLTLETEFTFLIFIIYTCSTTVLCKDVLKLDLHSRLLMVFSSIRFLLNNSDFIWLVKHFFK